MAPIRRLVNGDKSRARAALVLWLLTLVVPIYTVVWYIRALVNWDSSDDLYGVGVAIGLVVLITISAFAAVILGGIAIRLRSGPIGRLIWLGALLVAAWLSAALG